MQTTDELCIVYTYNNIFNKSFSPSKNLFTIKSANISQNIKPENVWDALKYLQAEIVTDCAFNLYDKTAGLINIQVLCGQQTFLNTVQLWIFETVRNLQAFQAN